MKSSIIAAMSLAMLLLAQACGKPPAADSTGTGARTNAAQYNVPVEKVTYEQFRKADYQEKNRIIRALNRSKVSDSDTVALYVQILESKDIDKSWVGEGIIKSRVADNLGQIGRAAAPALPALARMVTTPGFLESGIRYDAAEAIGNIGPPVDEAIIQALVTGANIGYEGYHCACVLQKLGEKGREGLLALISAESDAASDTAVFLLLQAGQCTKEDVLKRLQSMSEPKRSKRIKDWEDAWAREKPHE